MGIFKRKVEQRAEETTTQQSEDILLSALLGTTTITKKEALEIPSVSGCIDYIANIVSMLPIKLYKEKDGEVEEVRSDKRIMLLNDDTGDTLDAVQLWRAIVKDYFLGKGGYIYINKKRNDFISLHYVDEENISIMKGLDPIFKSYDILVNSKPYKPFDFIKILRNTKDGAQGSSIIEDNSIVLSVYYQSQIFEENLVKKGGNKKGFLKSAKTLTEEVMTRLKEAFRRLYSNNSENVVVLNNGMEFQEASNTSVEMQLNENKQTNAKEICKIFLISNSVIEGNAKESEYKNSFTAGVMPVLKAIECALNRDFLLEKEKYGEEVYYYAFDTKELLKGSIKERFEAYKIAIDSNFLGIDEVRYMEDKKPLGINWIKLGLDSVLYNPATGEIYTPNTNAMQNMDNLKGGE